MQSTVFRSFFERGAAQPRRALTTLLGAALLAWGTVASAQQAVVLKFSHTDTAIGARQKAAELFAQKVEAYTEGRYKVQIFHSGQLANDTKSLEQLQLGGLDFAVTGASTDCAQGSWLAKVEDSVAKHLFASSETATNWDDALDVYEGLDAVALMTIHKSKGLEYHAVAFVGLDDAAWWSYAREVTESTAGFFSPSPVPSNA